MVTVRRIESVLDINVLCSARSVLVLGFGAAFLRFARADPVTILSKRSYTNVGLNVSCETIVLGKFLSLDYSIHHINCFVANPFLYSYFPHNESKRFIPGVVFNLI